MKHSVYLAGKIPKGDEVEGFCDWREEFQRIINEKISDFPGVSGIVCLNPNTFTVDQVDGTEDFFGRDVHMVNISDALVVDAREKIGAGTAQEMLIAKYYGKPVVTVLPKNSHYWRETYVHGGVVEYRHPFIFSTSDAVVGNFEDAVEWLFRFFFGETRISIKGISILDEYQKSYLDNHSHKDNFLNEWKKELE
jgi:hypothetical protein